VAHTSSANAFPDITSAAVTKPIIGFGGVNEANAGIQNRSFRKLLSIGRRPCGKNPQYGALLFVTQTSYVTRSPWFVAVGTPKNAHLTMGYVSLKYVLRSLNFPLSAWSPNAAGKRERGLLISLLLLFKRPGLNHRRSFSSPAFILFCGWQNLQGLLTIILTLLCYGHDLTTIFLQLLTLEEENDKSKLWIALLMGALVAAGSAQTSLNGAGATFPNPIYQKWFSE